MFSSKLSACGKHLRRGNDGRPLGRKIDRVRLLTQRSGQMHDLPYLISVCEDPILCILPHRAVGLRACSNVQHRSSIATSTATYSRNVGETHIYTSTPTNHPQSHYSHYVPAVSLTPLPFSLVASSPQLVIMYILFYASLHYMLEC